MAIRIGIAAVLVAIAGAVSPFVAQAAVDLDARQAPWLSRALARATGSTLTDRIPLYPLIVPNPDARLPAPGQITLPGPTGSLLPGVVDSPHIADGLTSDGCAFCHRASSASEGKLTIAPYRDQSLKAAAEAYLGTEFGLCFRCHSEAPFIAPVGGTAFDLHALHLGGVNQPGTGGLDIRVPGDGQGNAICAECHFQLHLTAAQVDAQQVNFAPNVLPRGGVLTWTGPGSGTCTLTCHGASHRAAGYEPAAVQNAALGVDARITIATSGTTLAGDAQTFTVTVERNDGTGTGWEPVDGIAVDPSPAGIGTITGGTCNNSAPDTNAGGQCTIIVNSTSAGTMTVNATAVVEVEGVVGPITVNVATDGHGAHDISNVATWVDARISIGTSGTNQVGDPQTFTVFVEKNGGSGWVGANAVTIDSTASGAGTITGGSCGSSVGSSRVDLQACKLEYSIVSPK